MKSNDFMILYVLVCGIIIGAIMHGAISRHRYKTDVRRKASIESVYDPRFKSFEYHGHRYLKYMDVVQAFSATLHDPDCPCWTNRLETVK